MKKKVSDYPLDTTGKCLIQAAHWQAMRTIANKKIRDAYAVISRYSHSIEETRWLLDNLTSDDATQALLDNNLTPDGIQASLDAQMDFDIHQAFLADGSTDDIQRVLRDAFREQDWNKMEAAIDVLEFRGKYHLTAAEIIVAHRPAPCRTAAS